MWATHSLDSREALDREAGIGPVRLLLYTPLRGRAGQGSGKREESGGNIVIRACGHQGSNDRMNPDDRRFRNGAAGSSFNESHITRMRQRPIGFPSLESNVMKSSAHEYLMSVKGAQEYGVADLVAAKGNLCSGAFGCTHTNSSWLIASMRVGRGPLKWLEPRLLIRNGTKLLHHLIVNNWIKSCLFSGAE